MDGNEINLRISAAAMVAVKRYLELLAASLGGLMTTGVIDQDISHHPGCQTVKLCSSLPFDFLLIHQPQISFIDQGCWLQGVVGALAPKISRRQSAQLVIDQRHKALQRGRVTIAPL